MLPELTFRQLEVFCATCRERSYSHAALELRSSRANVKRVCAEFEAAVGRQLFKELADRSLEPTPFARELLQQVGPLSRSLRKLGEGVRTLHLSGRILRFAAPGEFFRGSLFTGFIAALDVADQFRSCFVRIEAKRFRSALLNAECDVYFGLGLGAADRLDIVDLGAVPWRQVRRAGRARADFTCGTELGADRPWWISTGGEPGVAETLLDGFRATGAKGGAVIAQDEAEAWCADPSQIPDEGVLFHPDTSATPVADSGPWPSYRISACLRRNHPYAELKPRLMSAAEHFRNGHGH